jgi:hypothetical protein
MVYQEMWGAKQTAVQLVHDLLRKWTGVALSECDIPQSPADQWGKLGLSERQASFCRACLGSQQLAHLTEGLFFPLFLFFFLFYFWY